MSFLSFPIHHHHHHRPLGPHHTVHSTCYAQGGPTATPHVNAYFGEVAVLPGFLRLGTKIRLDRPAFGRRDFVVRDHIGEGSELDIFFPSESACLNYGSQQRGFRVVP
jgi:3D (Asp-Asp-Asp) domain-containing protein